MQTDLRRSLKNAALPEGTRAKLVCFRKMPGAGLVELILSKGRTQTARVCVAWSDREAKTPRDRQSLADALIENAILSGLEELNAQ